MDIHSGVYGLRVGGILSLGWGIAHLIWGTSPLLVSDVLLVGAGLLQLYLVRRWPKPPSSPSTPTAPWALAAERHRLFVENFQGIAFQGDLDTLRPILLGGQVRQITGYEPEEFLAGRVGLIRLLARRDLPRVRQELRRLLQDSEYFTDIEFRIRPKGGGERWVRLVAARADTARSHRFIQGAIYDIHERKEAEAAALRSEQTLRQITNAMTDMVMLLDLDGVVQYVTPSVKAMLGYEQDELVGRRADLLVDPADLPKLEQQGRQAQAEGRSYRVEYRCRHKEGHYVWLEATVDFVPEEGGCPLSVVVGARDISERRRQRAHVEFMAFHDELTQLPNRRALKQQAEQALEIARTSGQPLALLYFDLDNFKAINDTLGHDVGDELLVELAAILSHQLRSGDLLARLGGDEFACLLPGTDPEQARQVAIRMSRAVRGTFTLREQEIALGMSVGVACFPHDGQSFVELLKASDIAMYQAKESGSRVMVYEAGKSPYTYERLRLEAGLHEAVEQHAFEFYYQPFLRLVDGMVDEAEALLRWRNRGQLVNAADFIPLAEETGLIGRIDQAAFSLALWQLVRWQQQGLPYRLSLNISAQSVARKGALTELNHLVQHGGLEPHRLTLEITESALLHDSEEVRSALLELKALGMRLAMDDFGSGYASLAYLRRLPLDRIKIDRSFITHLGSSRRDEKLVRAAIDLGHSLEAEVLAEGVETFEQLRWLRENGCDLVQGNLIGLPASLETWYPSQAVLSHLQLALAPRRPSPMG